MNKKLVVFSVGLIFTAAWMVFTQGTLKAQDTTGESAAVVEEIDTNAQVNALTNMELNALLNEEASIDEAPVDEAVAVEEPAAEGAVAY